MHKDWTYSWGLNQSYALEVLRRLIAGQNPGSWFSRLHVTCKYKDKYDDHSGCEYTLVGCTETDQEFTATVQLEGQTAPPRGRFSIKQKTGTFRGTHKLNRDMSVDLRTLELSS